MLAHWQRGFRCVTTSLLGYGGTAMHRAAKRTNRLLGQRMPNATIAEIAGAAHAMIWTHAREVADLIAQHSARTEHKSAAELYQ